MAKLWTWITTLWKTPFSMELEIGAFLVLFLAIGLAGYHLKSLIDQPLKNQNAALFERVENEDRGHAISTVLANGVDQYAKSVAGLPKVSANAMVVTIDPAFRLRIQARIYAGERARSGDGKM